HKGGCNALYVMPDPILINWRAQILAEAARLRLPAFYFQPEFALEGGLMSYSANVEDMFRRAAGYVDRILKGAKPSDLPIQHPTQFELVINLKTAKTLGLPIQPSLLMRADRIIE
ncbi:MAG: ABC transporter substrate binding protein, partial [Candidatus Rokuibacteriota bacterium]